MIAQSALNLAVIIYVVQLVPQLWRTASQKKMTDLSMTMIRFVWLGWIMDVLYAKLYAMPMQYFVVSYLGLSQTMLWLFLLFNRKQIDKKELTSLCFCVCCLIFSPIKWVMKLKFFPILSIGQLCFWVCWCSQLARSFVYKSANDISLLSLFLSLVGSCCSLIAGFILGWEMQYIINLILVVIFHMIIFLMLSYYRSIIKQSTSY